MKIIKQFFVNGEERGLISDEVILELSSPGRARFLVQSDQPLTGVVQFAIGWSGADLFRLFVGYIDKQTTINNKQQLLFCRELSAALNRPLPMGLRHVNLKDILSRINKDTALSFVTSEQSYSQIKTPHFHHLGGGYHALDALGRVFRIPSYIWQQQGDGSVYVGSWQDSRWASRPVEIPDKLFTEHMAYNSARLMMIPSLRPGVKFNRGIINKLTCSNDSMVITWTQ